MGERLAGSSLIFFGSGSFIEMTEEQKPGFSEQPPPPAYGELFQQTREGNGGLNKGPTIMLLISRSQKSICTTPGPGRGWGLQPSTILWDFSASTGY